MSDETKNSSILDPIERALNSAARAENVLARLHDNDPVAIQAIRDVQQDLLRDVQAAAKVIDDLRQRKPEDLSVTREGLHLIRAWRAALREEQRAAKKLVAATQERERTTQVLGKWLTPDDAKIDEKFAVWVGDSLIESSLRVDGVFAVQIRSLGKTLREM